MNRGYDDQEEETEITYTLFTIGRKRGSSSIKQGIKYGAIALGAGLLVGDEVINYIRGDDVDFLKFDLGDLVGGIAIGAGVALHIDDMLHNRTINRFLKDVENSQYGQN